MKTLYILLFTMCFSAFAKADTTPTTATATLAVNWTGTYDTTFGEIILNQKGKSVVGTYRNLGAIRSTKIQGNEMYLRFENGSKTGYAKFTKTNTGFKGLWSWNNKRNEGSWNGTKKGNASQQLLKGDWTTNFQSIHITHNNAHIVAGHYGAAGGKLWGKYNPSTRILRGNYTTKQGAKIERFEMKFSGNSFSGKYNNTAMGSWTGTRVVAQVETKKPIYLKVTLNSVKLYKTPNRRKNSASLRVTSKMTHRGDAVWSKDWNNIRSGSLWSGNLQKDAVQKPNRYLIYEIADNVIQNSESSQFVLTTERDWERKSRDISLTHAIKYLSGETNPSDYPLVPNFAGRRRLPNSTDTFWLETVGGKRIIRGYGDIRHDGGDYGFGYHYTVEIVNKW